VGERDEGGEGCGVSLPQEGGKGGSKMGNPFLVGKVEKERVRYNYKSLGGECSGDYRQTWVWGTLEITFGSK